MVLLSLTTMSTFVAIVSKIQQLIKAQSLTFRGVALYN